MKRLTIVLVVACACRTRPPAMLAQHDVGAIAPPSGGVTAKLIPDPDSPAVQLGPDEEFVRPTLLEVSNAQPAYPAELVSLRLPPHTIPLRVFFDEKGRVYDVRQSPVATSTPVDQFTPAFERAARTALEWWQCWPAKIRKFRPGPDLDGDGKPDYRILVAERVLKTFFDVSFSFEVVNGVPVVKSK